MVGISCILPAAVFGLAFVAHASAASNTTFDASGVDPSTKASWCLAQSNNCNNLCGGPDNTEDNNCDNTSLDFTCKCSDGTTPDLSSYTGTIPTFECTNELQACISSTSDLDTQKQCNATFTCGTKTPKLVSVSSTASSTASATASGSSSATTTAAASSTTSSAAAQSTGAAVVLGYSSELVTGAGLMAAIGLLL